MMKKTMKRMSAGTSTQMAFLIVFFLLVNATLGFLLSKQSSSAMIDLIHGRMLDVSNTAAAMLDGDVLEKMTPQDAGSEEYETMMRTLRYFQENIDLDYIYCIQDAGNGHFVFGLDPTADDPGEFGSPVIYTDALYQASQGTPSVDAVPYEDEWGSFYSAYSPVFDSAGNVAGIVAVDFSKEWHDAQIITLAQTTVIISITSLVIGGMIVLSLTSRNRKRIQTVHFQLNELADNLERLMQEISNQSAVGIQAPVKEEKAQELGPEDIDSLGERILAMQDALHAQIAKVHEQAYIDSLTGVRNKASYLDTVRHIDMMITEGIAVFSVAVFDMNGLKTINDKYGHEVGDVALIDAANALISVFGKQNIFRIGGDEFIAITKTLSEADLQYDFTQVDDALTLLNKEEHPYKMALSLSKGQAVYKPGEDTEYKVVFRRADQEMYRDKAAYYMKYGDRRRK